MPPKKRKARSGTVEHTVRAANGRYIRLTLSRKTAMSAMCTECLGFEQNPAECTSYCCPIFPFRAATRATRRGNLDHPPKKEQPTANNDPLPPSATAP